jgi:hypothetical protein
VPGKVLVDAAHPRLVGPGPMRTSRPR